MLGAMELGVKQTKVACICKGFICFCHLLMGDLCKLEYMSHTVTGFPSITC